MTDRARLLDHLVTMRGLVVACRALVRASSLGVEPSRVSAALRGLDAIVAGVEQVRAALGGNAPPAATAGDTDTHINTPTRDTAAARSTL